MCSFSFSEYTINHCLKRLGMKAQWWFTLTKRTQSTTHTCYLPQPLSSVTSSPAAASPQPLGLHLGSLCLLLFGQNGVSLPLKSIYRDAGPLTNPRTSVLYLDSLDLQRSYQMGTHFLPFLLELTSCAFDGPILHFCTKVSSTDYDLERRDLFFVIL